MNFISHFYKRTLKYDLINKFSYQNTKKLPKLKKITLNFGCNTNDTKKLAGSLLSLQLIANQKGVFTTTKKSNVSLKIRKGNPVGCKITLRKHSMFDFFEKMLVTVIPTIKNFNGFKIHQKTTFKKLILISKITNIFNFKELEKNYFLFNNNLPELTITFVINLNINKEIFFIIKSLQIPNEFKKQI